MISQFFKLNCTLVNTILGKIYVFIKTNWLWIFPTLILLITFYFSLPKQIFNAPLSTVVEDKNGELLAAQIAKDGQWRFPASDSLPTKVAQCLVMFEDQYFYKHFGINPLSIIRATFQNIRSKKIVSGGSTITAQVIRMSRKNKARTPLQKTIEFLLATRLEMRYSKAKILSLYAHHAPFGGNVVGIDAAAWRYYGREAYTLSWAEAATLAVLPNAPALISPSKNRKQLLRKRNRLLNKLFEKNVIDSLTHKLSKEEPLPDKPQKIPQIAPHLLTRIINDGKQGMRIKSSIDKNMQITANQIVEKHHRWLKENKIFNAAVLIADVKTGKVLAYVGNTFSENNLAENFVDIITANRSTGSTLKPFLYALMQKEGHLLPSSLVADIPTDIAGYQPKNFNKNYRGAVPANLALAHSLNIPAVRMLQDYGIEKFKENLNKLPFSTFTKSADYYGLSLILGGAETNLWELTGAYASMGRVLLNFSNQNGKYNTEDYHQLSYLKETKKTLTKKLTDTDLLGAGAIWLTLEALTESQRPIEGNRWKRFSSAQKIAWKTGTSFGFRDAWSVGLTPKYAIGVWVGNADGEGRPGLVGAQTAAPMMFDLFKQFREKKWFEIPYDDLKATVICAESGYKASPICTKIDTIYCAENAERTAHCPYHQLIHLDKNEQFRVNSNCYSVTEMVNKSWFVLPPIIEWYYKKNNAFYQTLPPYSKNCLLEKTNNMAIIYPKQGAKIFMPKGFAGKQQKTVAEVAHRQPDVTVYWHIDNIYIGKTTHIHKKTLFATEGGHTLTIVDSEGETKKIKFKVLKK